MIGFKADKDYLKLYKKEKTFFVFYKEDMFVINDKNYRKLSKKEVYDISHWALAEVEPGKYVYERISKEDVFIVIHFPKAINKVISKNFPKKYKKELTKLFRDRYLMKLVSYIYKNESNKTNFNFIQIHKEVLSDMSDLKYEIKGKEYFLLENMDIKKIDKMILKHLKELIDWYGFIQIGRRILKRRKGEFKIHKDKLNAEEKEKKRLKIIEDRER